MKAIHKHLIAAALAAGLGLSAVAQTAPPAAGQPQGQQFAHRGGHHQMDPAKRAELRQLRMERRLAALKLKLQITAAQEGAWNAWTNAIKPNPQLRAQRPSRVDLERMTTPERIDRMRSLRAARTADMDRRAEATKAFYGTLSADQKKVFDAIGARMMKRGGKGGFRGHRGHHRG